MGVWPESPCAHARLRVSRSAAEYALGLCSFTEGTGLLGRDVCLAVRPAQVRERSPLGAERELSARLGEGGVRVECWGREALNTPLTAETDVRLVNEHFEDIAAPSLLLLGSKKEMEQLCDVGRELAPVANAAPCAVPWSVLARATDASDDEFGKELARLELSAFLEAQGLAVVRNDAPPLVEQSCPDLAACAPLLPTLRGDANQPLADLRVLLAAHLVKVGWSSGLPRASRARLGEPPAHAAARGAHEVLALRWASSTTRAPH